MTKGPDSSGPFSYAGAATQAWKPGARVRDSFGFGNCASKRITNNAQCLSRDLNEGAAAQAADCPLHIPIHIAAVGQQAAIAIGLKRLSAAGPKTTAVSRRRSDRADFLVKINRRSRLRRRVCGIFVGLHEQSRRGRCN